MKLTDGFPDVRCLLAFNWDGIFDRYNWCFFLFNDFFQFLKAQFLGLNCENRSDVQFKGWENLDVGFGDDLFEFGISSADNKILIPILSYQIRHLGSEYGLLNQTLDILKDFDESTVIFI